MFLNEITIMISSSNGTVLVKMIKKKVIKKYLIHSQMADHITFIHGKLWTIENNVFSNSKVIFVYQSGKVANTNVNTNQPINQLSTMNKTLCESFKQLYTNSVELYHFKEQLISQQKKREKMRELIKHAMHHEL